jgi:hypothetical protein
LPVCGRSAADILDHIAWSKWRYDDYAFGFAALRGDQPPLLPRRSFPSMQAGGPTLALQRTRYASLRAPLKPNVGQLSPLLLPGARLGVA